MSGRHPDRDLGIEPFLDVRAGIMGAPTLQDAEPTVLILEQPTLTAAPPRSEPSIRLAEPNLLAPPQGASGGLYVNNVIVSASMGLLLRMAPLRLSNDHRDPNGLHAELLTDLKQLSVALRERGCNEIVTTAARYILCAALDEAVLSTPWGAKSIWSQRSLLATLHGETWGGEKLFAMLAELQKDVDGNIDLIELIDICLSLGFKGRYRLQEQGESQLYELRISLGRLISTRRQARPSSLAGACVPETGQGQLRGWLPPWVTAVGCGVLAVALYVFLFIRISDQNSVVLAALRLIQATE